MMRLCCSGGRVTNKDIDNYNWLDSFHQRKKKHDESINDWLDCDWPCLVESMEINGVTYTKEDYNRLRLIREAGLEKLIDQATFISNC